MHERYDLIKEEKKVISETTIALPKGVTADLIKFIHGRKITAP